MGSDARTCRIIIYRISAIYSLCFVNWNTQWKWEREKKYEIEKRLCVVGFGLQHKYDAFPCCDAIEYRHRGELEPELSFN